MRKILFVKKEQLTQISTLPYIWDLKKKTVHCLKIIMFLLKNKENSAAKSSFFYISEHCIVDEEESLIVFNERIVES